MLLQILAASICGGVASLFGGILLLWKENIARRLSLVLVSFAVGSLLATSFFDLLPEAFASPAGGQAAWLIIAGILTIFVFEKVLQWHHCHNQESCDFHSFSATVIFGDTVHNFIDGVVIALSFAVGTQAGIATTLAIFMHEVPQEIGDFGVLLHSGYAKGKIILYNFLSALASVGGAIVGYFLLPWITPLLGGLLAFAAGMFLYIAVSDLLPELRHKTSKLELAHLASILAGLLIIWGLGVLFPE
ncbi:ZIP family metal transporter [Candidatus Parcubacteria bacterium]|nr:MAG: ZIP family metal transporter [Candidatus Parcubacteria bacterium]